LRAFGALTSFASWIVFCVVASGAAFVVASGAYLLAILSAVIENQMDEGLDRGGALNFPE